MSQDHERAGGLDRARDTPEDARRPSTSDEPTRPAGPDIQVDAVRTTRGRSATTIHVALEAERLTDAEGPPHVEKVVAEFPNVEGDDTAPRWEQQPLDRAGDEVGDGPHRQRYVATHYEGCDASKYGIRVKVKTAAGTLAKDGIPVREADKPEGPGS